MKSLATMACLFLFFSLIFVFDLVIAARFTCNGTSTRHTCQALLGYVPANSTTLADIKALFQLRSLRAILATNSLPLSTPASAPVPASSTIRIRFPCLCSARHGTAFHPPFYKVQPGDTLDAVARGTFAGFVTYQEIAAANNISNPTKLDVGKELRIPLPCSCDAVAGEDVVHYAHKVDAGSSIKEIADRFDVSEASLTGLNSIADPKNLQAGQILDIPLRVCHSSIRNISLDRSLRIPNGSSVLTANNCVQCSCSSASWQLACAPTEGLSLSICPAAKCGDLFLGNTTSKSSCESSTCTYAGYTNGTSFSILTSLSSQFSCTNSEAPTGSQLATSSSPSSLWTRWWKLHGYLVFLDMTCILLNFVPNLRI